ncbi:CAP domain-containing protein [Pannus brasiliensis CCIBt3594]|uniref:CAP domain-containing protein n=1 Tax=Pannus brasiliensis CCIBt3594 TaxID=1427578 RepID=A0AAW9QMF1_9CHRO
MKRFWLSIALWGALTGCQSVKFNPIAENSPPLPLPVKTAPSFDESSLPFLEEEILQKVNEYRRSNGLPPLTLNPAISRQARIHSQRMATGAVPFSHEGFQQRARAIAVKIPYRAVAENVAVNQGHDDPTTVALQGWIESKSHRENLKGDFDKTGIGAAIDSRGKLYFTQIFVKRDVVGDISRARSISPSPSIDPLADGTYLRTLEQMTNAGVNEYRKSRNLPPLLLDPNVSYVARLFSQKMASKQAPFSHDGFDDRVKSVQTMMSLRGMGENLAWMKGYNDPVAEAVKGWIHSPGHEKNMVGDYDITGIGIAKNSDGEYYFTQLFVKRR